VNFNREYITMLKLAYDCGILYFKLEQS